MEPTAAQQPPRFTPDFALCPRAGSWHQLSPPVAGHACLLRSLTSGCPGRSTTGCSPTSRRTTVPFGATSPSLPTACSLRPLFVLTPILNSSASRPAAHVSLQPVLRFLRLSHCPLPLPPPCPRLGPPLPTHCSAYVATIPPALRQVLSAAPPPCLLLGPLGRHPTADRRLCLDLELTARLLALHVRRRFIP